MTQSGILSTRSNLSKIVDKVMSGEEHIILRNNVAVAKIVPIQENLLSQAQALIEKTKAIRQSLQSVTMEEMVEWKKEGRP